MARSTSSSWTTRSDPEFGPPGSSSTRDTSPLRRQRERSALRPPAAEGHRHAPRREPAGRERHRPGPRRSSSSSPTSRILMLTAVNDATTAALCMQRGAFDYLIKPMDLSHLGRGHHGRAAAAAHGSRASSINSGSRRKWPCTSAELRRERATWSGCRSRRSRRWSMRWRPRTRICGATRRASPTSRPWSRPSWGCHDEMIEAVRTGGPAARHRQDRDSRGDPEQAGSAHRRGVRPREAARAGRVARSWPRSST